MNKNKTVNITMKYFKKTSLSLGCVENETKINIKN